MAVEFQPAPTKKGRQPRKRTKEDLHFQAAIPFFLVSSRARDPIKRHQNEKILIVVYSASLMKGRPQLARFALCRKREGEEDLTLVGGKDADFSF
jgi:hypothetical protein